VFTNELKFKHVIGGGFSALGVTHDNRVYRWGRFSTSTDAKPLLTPEAISFFATLKHPIKSLAAGAQHFLALTGTLFPN